MSEKNTKDRKLDKKGKYRCLNFFCYSHFPSFMVGMMTRLDGLRDRLFRLGRL